MRDHLLDYGAACLDRISANRLAVPAELNHVDSTLTGFDLGDPTGRYPLRTLVIPDRYFDEERNRRCIDLLSLLDRTGDPWSADRSGGMLRILRGLASICRYLELKPNLFGLGFNLNRVIERLDRPDESNDR